ncbi:MAG: CoA transferase [Anaerolineales bacterium]|nr:CoA transferase [Anaerolineales bacterium]
MLKITVITLAINIPGPVAVARLRQLGANVTKIEPPTGDPLALAAPAWYDHLHQGVRVIALDLKREADRAQLEPLLASADLLLTSMRPRALARLRLDAASVAARHPHLCQLSIVGYPGPQANEAGHDLTYQASLGLVQPPRLPRTLLADLAGAERAVSEALALLLARAQGQGAAATELALSAAATPFADPWRYGLTRPEGVLGGGIPGYNLYETRDGWVALAALEPHFWRRFLDAMGSGGENAGISPAPDLAHFFRQRPTAEWLAWARAHDIPLAAVAE